MSFTPESLEQLQTIAIQSDIRFIRLQFTDLMGTVKLVEVPVRKLMKTFSNRIRFDGSSIEGFLRLEESDMFLHPDLSTWAVLPWPVNGGRVARLICEAYLPDETPFMGDPRRILKNVLEEGQDLKLNDLGVSTEIEFYLLEVEADGTASHRLSDQGGYFDVAPIDLGERCRRDLVLRSVELGIPAASSHHEGSPGQHEVDVAPLPAVAAADAVVSFKMAARVISKHHHLYATFMPRPYTSSLGSGLHLRFHAPTGTPLANPEDPFGLSGQGKSFVAGILKHARALTAVTNPTVNSYKRLRPRSEAPLFTVWSNRAQAPLVRVTATEKDQTVIEVRSPDPACNPYLSLAVLLQAGLDGVQQSLPLPSPLHEDPFQMPVESRLRRGILPLPNTLEEAIQALEEDEVVQAALGAHASNRYMRAKLLEWEMYSGEIHPWERDQYLTRS